MGKFGSIAWSLALGYAAWKWVYPFIDGFVSGKKAPAESPQQGA